MQFYYYFIIKPEVVVCKDVLNSTWEITVSSLCSGSGSDV
jgi:hypothetical protein